MNYGTTSGLIAFVLFAMGVTAFLIGDFNWLENKKSKTGIQMFIVCACVFVWDFGYGWMSLCFDDDFAYIPRAVALLSVNFYMFFTLRYVGTITNYPSKKLNIFLGIFITISQIAWFPIIQKNAVEFVSTPWGYWYYSKMSIWRIIQFSSILAAFVQYYFILGYGFKRVNTKREKYVLNRFRWFGPILFIGYLFDTLIPTLFKMPAIPGSSICAFLSALILFRISQNNKVFGLSKQNVSKYVFEQVNIPVIITDRDGKIVLYNDITPQYIKAENKNLKNHTLDEYFFKENEDIVKTKDSEIVFKYAKTEVNDQFDDLLYSIYFFQDVSEEQAAFKMVEESRQLAEEANRAKSNFLANMSHEIRTPMNAIIGMSDIIIHDKSISDKTLSQVNEIKVAGHNLLGIINDILDISKIEAGKYDLVEEAYELPSLVHDVTHIIAVRLQESSAKLIIKLDDTLPKSLIGDVGRIRQILLNILGNAVKFINKGSITFTVTWNKDETNPLINFDVADTGIGIKPEDMDKIFGEFNQVDTRRNRNVKGTGLGLAISKHLAELMGGTITVESVYGKGSTFHITVVQKIKHYKPIGATLAKDLEMRQYQNTINKQKLEIVPRPNAKVLIVDDTKVNLIIAANLMKRYGMEIDTAESGKQAIEMIQQKDYNVVFMDHMMPEMDGVEATKAIRQLGPKYENLTIIALTANAVSDAKEMFLKEGLQDFVAKPIDMNVLDDVLNRWIPV